VPATRVARIVGDHPMSRPVAMRIQDVSLLDEVQRVPLASPGTTSLGARIIDVTKGRAPLRTLRHHAAQRRRSRTQPTRASAIAIPFVIFFVSPAHRVGVAVSARFLERPGGIPREPAEAPLPINKNTLRNWVTSGDTAAYARAYAWPMIRSTSYTSWPSATSWHSVPARWLLELIRQIRLARSRFSCGLRFRPSMR
jgi:hypothetical protein